MSKTRLKQILFHSAILILLIVLELGVLTQFINPSRGTRQIAFMFYFLTIAPLILFYIITVVAYKLFTRQYRMLRGGKFQTRLMVYFAIIVIIPLIPLIFLTNNLINQAIELWLTRSIEESLESGLNLISEFQEKYKQEMKHYLKIISSDKMVRYSIIFQSDSKMYQKGVAALCRKYMIDSIFVFNKDKAIMVEYQSILILKKIFEKDVFNEALSEKETVKLITEGENEYIAGFSPVHNELKNVIGVLAIAKMLPKDFSSKANKIASSLQAYKQIELYKKPLVKGITTVTVITVGLFIILIAITASYFIAKGITEPIKVLLDGTRNIARGNLDFEIKYNAKDEIKLLINAFNQMTRDLKASKQALFHAQRIAAWRDIARKIAHEIKNPLTPIKLSAERLLKKADSKDFKKILNKSVKTISKEVDTLKTLVTEFSEFARMPHLKLSVENLNHIIIETLFMFEAVPHIEITTDLEKELPLLSLDKQKIKEVIVNIINNSITALEKQKEAHVNIKTWTKSNVFGRFIYLEVSDNGPGMDKQVMEKVFDPYFTTRKEGTGLGLSIVEKIVTEHHGKVRCESEPGKGTKIIIELNASSK
ncbi:MAG: HAMP domain-containing protein [Spirochaetes bacterium]|nr:HAMP domain-containing protein [Spirochaetota bacterium]